MEKRFELLDGAWIEDVDTGYCYSGKDLADLLNKQDREIRILEQINHDCREQSAKDFRKIYDLSKENQQIKQSQNQKAIEVLDSMKTYLINNASPILLSYNEYVSKVFEIIDNQIAELRAKN